MAILNVHYMSTTLAILAMGGIIILMASNEKMVAGEACQGDLQGLITHCAMYVQKSGPKRDPSQACCNVITYVDIPCACNYISKEIEQVIDMDKVVHVAQFCGKPLAHGMKCGSYTVP